MLEDIFHLGGSLFDFSELQLIESLDFILKPDLKSYPSVLVAHLNIQLLYHITCSQMPYDQYHIPVPFFSKQSLMNSIVAYISVFPDLSPIINCI